MPPCITLRRFHLGITSRDPSQSTPITTIDYPPEPPSCLQYLKLNSNQHVFLHRYCQARKSERKRGQLERGGWNRTRRSWEIRQREMRQRIWRRGGLVRFSRHCQKDPCFGWQKAMKWQPTYGRGGALAARLESWNAVASFSRLVGIKELYASFCLHLQDLLLSRRVSLGLYSRSLVTSWYFRWRSLAGAWQMSRNRSVLSKIDYHSMENRI